MMMMMMMLMLMIVLSSLYCAAIKCDAESIMPHSNSIGNSSYSQLPLSVVQTGTDDATQSHDGPMDFSVTSRWTQSTATAVNVSSTTVTNGSTFLPRDAMHKRGIRLYRCAVSVRLSRCSSVTFVYSVETNKSIFNFLHHQEDTPVWFFHTKHYGNIPTGTPIMKA